ncbi:MAG: response regulator transcription factor [Anaerolineae bacterium]
MLVVDDEPTITNVLRSYLEQEGFHVAVAHDGPSALAQFRSLKPEVIILDIMLPGIDGLEILQKVRQESNAFVLMLTARADETDRIVGLTMGADDYVTKPFSPREVVARVKALLRRARRAQEEPEVLTFGRLRIDEGARQVWKDDQPIDLTSIEFDILLALAHHPNRVLSREQIIELVWGYDYYGDERVVDVHIGRIRKKLEDEPSSPQWITTVRGIGYRFVPATT